MSRPSARAFSAPEIALAVVTAVLLAARLHAAETVGYGDSEALYASWALHPQASYLDHPGLVGLFARALGGGGAPTPLRAHVVTTTIATLFPLLSLAVARAFGATRRASAAVGLAIAVTPQIAVGLFALTPDVLLAPLWMAALGLAYVGLTSEAGGPRAAAAFLFAGLAAGVATVAKVSGALLLGALVLTYLSLAQRPRSEDSAPLRLARRHTHAASPWLGLLLAGLVISPVVAHERALGWPMLRHRFVDTQTGAGASLHNLGALAVGQLLYVSPFFVWLAFVIARDLVRTRREDVASRLLFAAFAVPFVPLLALSIWSPVAEPHWLAPALLALPLHAARRWSRRSPRAVKRGIVLAAVMTAVVYAFVLVPSASLLVPRSADPRADLARELYGWPEVTQAAREAAGALGAGGDDPGDVVFVGPHWTICAQLAVALPNRRVGCATPVPDDFDRWLPRAVWRRAPRVVFVTDDVFAGDGTRELPAHAVIAERRVDVLRGAKVARRFEVVSLARRQVAASDHSAAPASTFAACEGIATSPASRISARSSFSPGFGVVSSFSP